MKFASHEAFAGSMTWASGVTGVVLCLESSCSNAFAFSVTHVNDSKNNCPTTNKRYCLESKLRTLPSLDFDVPDGESTGGQQGRSSHQRSSLTS